MELHLLRFEIKGKRLELACRNNPDLTSILSHAAAKSYSNDADDSLNQAKSLINLIKEINQDTANEELRELVHTAYRQLMINATDLKFTKKN